MDPTARRRTVLADIGGQMAQGQGMSGIPVPASVKKKTVHRVPSNSRMSELPRASQNAQQQQQQHQQQHQQQQQQGSGSNGLQASGSMGVPRQSRQSMMPGPQPGRANPMGASQEGRRSTMSQRGAMDGHGGMSGARGDAGVYGRTPSTQRTMPSSVGRASLYGGGGGGRQSMAPVVTTGKSLSNADIRPIRDHGFQASAASNIIEFLREHRCPIQPDERFFNGKAATRDVHEIIKWLVKEFLDPGRVWDDRKVIDDLQTVLKDLRYPYQALLTRNALETAGSGTGWATICAFIDWLVNLCKAHTHWSDPDLMSDPVMMPVKKLDLNYEFIEDRLLWDYMARSYYNWFNHSVDEDHEAQEDITEMYDQLKQHSIQENLKLSEQLKGLDLELQQLQAEGPKLKQCQDENLRLRGDQTHLLEYINKLEAHKLELIEKREMYKRGIATFDKDIARAQEALAESVAAVAAQNLSPDEVLRMTQQPEILRQTRDDLERKKDDEQKRVYNQEMDIEAALYRVEMLLADYTSLARQIGVIDATIEELRSRGLDPSITYSIDPAILNANVPDLTSFATRLRSELWPAFQAFKERFRRELEEVQKHNIDKEGEHERLCQDTDRVAEQVETLQMRLQVTQDSAEDAKAVFQQERNQAFRTLSERQAELKDMLSASEQGIVLARSELEQTQFEFSEVVYKTELLQKSVVKQVEAMIESVSKAREYTANSIKSVRAFAETH